MTLHDFLSRLDGVKGYDGQYSARCPAHDDKRQSLSVSCGTDGRILLNCHAGCTPEEIVDAMGLKMKDLYQMEKPKKEVVAQYQYFDADGVPTVQKIRYSDKSFTWRRESAGDWIYNRQGVEPTLYTSTSDGTKSLPVDVFLVEGEKDVNTLKRLGKAAVSLPDGAQSKWYSNYADALQGRNITIIQDTGALDSLGHVISSQSNLHSTLTLIPSTPSTLPASWVWAAVPTLFCRRPSSNCPMSSPLSRQYPR